MRWGEMHKGLLWYILLAMGVAGAILGYRLYARAAIRRITAINYRLWHRLLVESEKRREGQA